MEGIFLEMNTVLEKIRHEKKIMPFVVNPMIMYKL